MLRIKLRDAMNAYKKRTGERLTYETLALKTGLKIATIQAISSRDGYNTRLSAIDKLCSALGCQPGDLMEWVPDDSDSSSHE